MITFLKTKKKIPLEFFENRGVDMFNLENNILNFERKYPKFDRSHLNFENFIQVIFQEKIDYYYTIVIKINNEKCRLDNDFFIEDNLEEFKESVVVLANKGYFFKDLPLYYFPTEVQIKKEDIFTPEWFKSTSFTEYRWLFLTCQNLKTQLS